MYYSSELLKKTVLSLYEGELLGVVDKLYFDKKMKKLMEIELIGENDARLILSTKNIYHVGKNAITVKNNQAVSLKVEDSKYYACPLGSKAYTIKGEYLGLIKEMNINDKFLTEKFSLDNNSTVEVNLLASSGKNTIVFYDPQDKINVAKFTPTKTPKFFKFKSVQKAKILPEEKPDEESVKTEPVVNAQNVNAVPAEENRTNLQNSDFLLGRICTKDIFNFNNEVLVKSHSVITKKVLKEVNRYGKLRELMLFSK